MAVCKIHFSFTTSVSV